MLTKLTVSGFVGSNLQRKSVTLGQKKEVCFRSPDRPYENRADPTFFYAFLKKKIKILYFFEKFWDFEEFFTFLHFFGQF